MEPQENFRPSRRVQLTLWRQPPTTRGVADLVQDGGAEALVEARRRGDHARYQEVTCRSALNRVVGMPFFSWTLNPYRGCTHGCHYCYARKYHAQFALNADDEFATVILVKTNIVDRLRRELARPGWTRETVALGTATDCYQPIEGHYQLTRAALEALLASRTPATVVTKGPMVVRDADLLRKLSAIDGSGVYVSVPCADEGVSAQLEPGVAPPWQRLRAARQLADAGVRVSVMMSPIVPGFSSRPALIDRTVEACAALKLRVVGANVMHLEDGARAHFLAWLAARHPALVDGYRQLYASKSPPAAYRDDVAHAVEAARQRHRHTATASGPSATARQTGST